MQSQLAGCAQAVIKEKHQMEEEMKIVMQSEKENVVDMGFIFSSSYTI